MGTTLPRHERIKIIDALSNLVKAAQYLDHLWSEDDAHINARNDILSPPYPLHPSFDDVASLLEAWRDSVVESILTPEERVALVLREIVSTPDLRMPLAAAGLYARALQALDKVQPVTHHDPDEDYE